MRRRAFLASALTATSTTVAGCSVGSRTEHTEPTVQRDDHDDAKYLEFHGEGAEIATVGVDPNVNPLPKNLFVSISHREETELQSLTQRVVAPDGDGSPPQLSVQSSSERNDIPVPSVSMSRDGRATVVEVEEFGDLADETVFIPLAVTGWPESAHRLTVESTVELVEMGAFDHTHVLDGALEFEFDAEANN